ncbi:carboxymuconolactone decarboxylase family protein [Mycobacterium sp. IDR2000157661]|uniref:carboxymuconolactone decarboxylase family protein n=1 Tax=Mycobacterium sp. IDR2000157661 TaxID=2867005 RepID=UPI001EEC1254|nr:carboxymuconolactone decarboxylase family protein [Mycobacterium sp. IDR2000157661]ULE34230.1 carboxymuconolactone decarboxylase family protein [Mycobacterium sp. IDR2000157661]
MSAIESARVAPGGFKELGPVNWAIAKLGARAIRAPRFSLFNVLGQHRLLFLAWLPYSGMLLGFASKLPVQDAETVILRVGHLRDCEYELQQHRRLARTRGIGPDMQKKIFEGPDAQGLSERQRALITATDEFVVTRGVSQQTWTRLAGHLTKPQLIEFCMLAAQYDGLAATITTLKVPLDFAD